MSELFNPIFGGLVAGLLLAIMSGPVFFALLQTGIEKGYLNGVFFALGVVISDSMYFLLAYLGISSLSSIYDDTIREVMGIIGGIFLLIFGFHLARKRPRIIRYANRSDKNSLLRSMGGAFLLNALNPFVLLYWISVVGAISSEYDFVANKIFAFFIACMAVVFSTDVLKAYLAYRLKNIITPRFMLWLNRIAGLILGITGIYLLLQALYIICNK
ncbi:MAG: LysE family translocator [Bacteroidota bacterium]|nr:LysE family translocator [Bacteroidota bacterium]